MTCNMNRQCKLSIVTKDYLTEFHCILDDMIQGITNAAAFAVYFRLAL